MSDRWPNKTIVGLTGNIATGKSTILRLAEERAAMALDADSLVHDILANDPEAQREIVDTFGPSVRQPDGAIDRAAVAAIVFSDADALQKLEQILHPRVRRLLHRKIDRAPHEVVFVEAIKLLEGGLADECDQIWVTRCPVETQVQRLMAYRQLDEETARQRVEAQSKQELKVAAADVIIDTDGSLEMTKAYFDLAWTRLQRRPAPDTSHQAATSSSEKDLLVGENGDGTSPDEESQTRHRQQETESVWQPTPRNFAQFGPEISVRRAQRDDIEAMVEMIRLATRGILTLEPADLLPDLGKRGYLIARQGEQISALGGWNAENLVATVDCLYVYPLEALTVTGAAVLHEIELTANELICEVIIALPGDLSPAGARQLLVERGFRPVDPKTLPKTWRSAVENTEQVATDVMLKVLRDTRQARVRTLKE